MTIYTTITHGRIHDSATTICGEAIPHDDDRHPSGIKRAVAYYTPTYWIRDQLEWEKTCPDCLYLYELQLLATINI